MPKPTIGLDCTYMDPPGVVRRKSILHKMFTHFHLVYPSPVSTFAAGTQNQALSFSSVAKCTIQESIGLVHPFRGVITLTSPTRVHPLTVIHPLTYVSPSKVTINCIYMVFLLSNRWGQVLIPPADAQMRLVSMLYSYPRQNFGSTSPLFSRYTSCQRRVRIRRTKGGDAETLSQTGADHGN